MQLNDSPARNIPSVFAPEPGADHASDVSGPDSHAHMVPKPATTGCVFSTGLKLFQAPARTARPEQTRTSDGDTRGFNAARIDRSRDRAHHAHRNHLARD